MKPNEKITQVLIKLAKEENQERIDTNTQEIDLSKMVAYFEYKMKKFSNINN